MTTSSESVPGTPSTAYTMCTATIELSTLCGSDTAGVAIVRSQITVTASRGRPISRLMTPDNQSGSAGSGCLWCSSSSSPAADAAADDMAEDRYRCLEFGGGWTALTVWRRCVVRVLHDNTGLDRARVYEGGGATACARVCKPERVDDLHPLGPLTATATTLNRPSATADSVPSPALETTWKRWQIAISPRRWYNTISLLHCAVSLPSSYACSRGLASPPTVAMGVCNSVRHPCDPSIPRS